MICTREQMWTSCCRVMVIAPQNTQLHNIRFHRGSCRCRSRLIYFFLACCSFIVVIIKQDSWDGSPRSSAQEPLSFTSPVAAGGEMIVSPREKTRSGDVVKEPKGCRRRTSGWTQHLTASGSCDLDHDHFLLHYCLHNTHTHDYVLMHQ